MQTPRRRPPSRHRRLFAALIIFSLAASPSFTNPAKASADFFTYEELIELYEIENPSDRLQTKLHNLLTTPFVSNHASENGMRPVKPESKAIGRFLRIAQWNIERGIEYEALETAFTDPMKFVGMLDPIKFPEGSARRAEIVEQLELLRAADVIVLNEVDWGLKRTGYRNILADLAAATNMNYAFGTEFIEIDPISLGTEKFEGIEEKNRRGLKQQIAIDPDRYKGLHGTAILSRFPLLNVRLIPFHSQGYDWYRVEKKGVGNIERGRRKASEIVFQERVEREVRRGGRTMLLADIEDADIPGGRLTIVATHLEAKSQPKHRVKQLSEVLEAIKDIRHPVVIAGDMNTSTRDHTPTSLKREIKKRLGSTKFWIEQGIAFLTGFSWPNGMMLAGVNEYRKQADPTVRSIKYVATNPESKFFDLLKEFRFSDGSSFDFRGDRERSVGSGKSPLANSNQRGSKGFVTTFEVERTIGFVGRFKLDWIFVKPPSLRSPYEEHQPYVFAPHFARTLKELNRSPEEDISDHDPIIVDLPFKEPAGAPG